MALQIPYMVIVENLMIYSWKFTHTIVFRSVSNEN